MGAIKTYTNKITREDGKSRNNNLKELILSSGKITFDKDNLNYNVTVEYEIEKLTINATPEDSKAKVIYQKENILKVGENKITITVDEDYVDSSFILRAVKSSNDSILAEITIDVVGLY